MNTKASRTALCCILIIAKKKNCVASNTKRKFESAKRLTVHRRMQSLLDETFPILVLLKYSGERYAQKVICDHIVMVRKESEVDSANAGTQERKTKKKKKVDLRYNSPLVTVYL